MCHGFEIEALPLPFQEVSIAEKLLTSIKSVAEPMIALQGGKHGVLRGHVFIVTRDPTSIARRPPEIQGTGSFFVVLAGPMKTLQEVSGRKCYICRTGMIKALLPFHI